MTNCAGYREQISELVDGELAEPLKTGLLSHLASCPECAKVYHAFALISSSLDEDMAEPPAGLYDDIMRSLPTERTSAEKKVDRKTGWRPAAALAACLALIIFAGSRAGIFSAKGAAPASMSMGENYLLDTPEEPEATFHELGTVSVEKNGEGEKSAPAPTPAPAERDAQPAEAPQDGNVVTGVQTAASSTVRVFSGGMAGIEEPVAVFADAESVAYIMELLAFSEAGDDISVSGAPTFTVEITHGDGTRETMDVYIVDGKLCCLRGGELYAAAGDISDLIAFIAAA